MFISNMLPIVIVNSTYRFFYNNVLIVLENIHETILIQKIQENILLDHKKELRCRLILHVLKYVVNMQNDREINSQS